MKKRKMGAARVNGINNEILSVSVMVATILLLVLIVLSVVYTYFIPLSCYFSTLLLLIIQVYYYQSVQIIIGMFICNT